MSLTDFIIIIFYGAAALFVILILVKALVEACIGSPSGWRERARLKSLKRSLKDTAEQCAIDPNADSRVSRILGMFYFDVVKNDAEVVEQVNAYHHAVLQEILSISKNYALDIAAFEVLEDLVLSRTALLRSYFEAESSRRTLRRKGTKKVPAWALDEYAKKLSDLKEKLDTNQKSIIVQLDKFKTKAATSNSPEEVVYH